MPAAITLATHAPTFGSHVCPVEQVDIAMLVAVLETAANDVHLALSTTSSCAT